GSAPVPAGYLADGGAPYSARNGLSYGWSSNLGASFAVDRNSSLSPDQRYDTFIQTQKNSKARVSWEIAVPNGTYSVHLVSGDAGSFSGANYKLNAEGVLTISGTPTSSTRWIEGNTSVPVSDVLPSIHRVEL